MTLIEIVRYLDEFKDSTLFDLELMLIDLEIEDTEIDVTSYELQRWLQENI